MSYNYETEKQKLFTEAGQKLFLAVRDNVQELLRVAGAFRRSHVQPKLGAYDNWEVMAAVDRLVELGEIVKLPRQCWGQYEVFTTPEVHNR